MSEIDLATKLNAVTDYYRGGTVWDRVIIDGLSTDQINAMYNALPAKYYTIDRTPSGLNLGRNYTNPFELPVTPGTDFDSNIQGGSYSGGNSFSGNVPANLITDPNTGLPVRQTAGALNSSGTLVAAIADRVSLATAGVNIGAKLGLQIDNALYQLNPRWWDEHLPTINPQTWNSLVGVNPVGDFFLRTLFGITGDNMTGYISDDMLAYYYQMLRDAGVFGDGTSTGTYTPGQGQVPLPTHYISQPLKIAGNATYILQATGFYREFYYTGAQYSIIINKDDQFYFKAFSRGTPITVYYKISPTGQWYSTTYSDIKRTYNNTEYYIAEYLSTSNTVAVEPYRSISNPVTRMVDSVITETATILFDGTVTPSGGIDGINPMSNATQYPPTNITGETPQQVKQQLKQEYPDLFTDSIKEKTMQDDGTISETEYVPIPWVTGSLNPEQPTTGEGKTQTDTQVDPTTADQILPTTPPGEPTQPPDTGDGDAPVPYVPTGSASSLWAVYNPSQSEINSFGAWLWSSNFVDQIKKLFSDPMQAIIGVHKVFATPSTGGSQTIKCGYLDSGVSASVVTSQYTTVDCGSASLREYFGNVFDYDPFTKISIFLPFIGIVPLNTADVMRSTISVKYKVDVITGACLAEVSVSRDGSGGILYTYGGSAIVTYPVSSGSYIGAVQAAISTALGIGSAIATGGASLGASAGMVLGGLSHTKTQVQHSGQYSGSSGAMGGKKPYLIISRPQTRTPSKIAEYEGIPTNSIHQLINCSGFTRVKDVHVTSATAYDDELQEIENLLKTGVIF